MVWVRVDLSLSEDAGKAVHILVSSLCAALLDKHASRVAHYTSLVAELQGKSTPNPKSAALFTAAASKIQSSIKEDTRAVNELAGRVRSAEGGSGRFTDLL